MPTDTDARHPSRCRECDGPLAHDQRYCLRCGERRGPLPLAIGVRIGEIYERGTPPAPEVAIITPSADEPAGSRDIVSSARAAAVSILLMIAFGCVVGSATGAGGVESLARAIVVAVHPPSAPAPPTQVSEASGGSGGGGGGGQSGAPAAGGGATATRQTITVSAGGGDSGGGSGGTTTSQTTTSPGSKLGLPPITHVWEIVLSGQGYDESFADATADPYLATTLRRRGELISNYYGVATSPLANGIALISGQGPTAQTLQDCPTFADIAPATLGKFRQVVGSGCVYPSSANTLPGELSAAGLHWRAYLQGLGGQTGPASSTSTSTSATTPAAPTASPPISTSASISTPTPTPTTTTPTTTTTTPTTSTTSTTTTPTTTTTASSTAMTARAAAAVTTCVHPTLGAADGDQAVTATNRYVTWRNPFVYFHSIASGRQCRGDDVGLSRLEADLRHPSRTPAFSYIAPDPCDDGSNAPCTPGAPAGLAPADAFLKSIVPVIEHSAAYRKGGLIAITFDDAPQTGTDADDSNCCDQPAFPNLPAPPSTTTSTTPATTTTTPPAPGATTTAPPVAGVTTTTTTTVASPVPGTTATTTTTSGVPAPGAAGTTTTATTPTTTLPPGTSPGGGRVGLLLISRYIKPNSVDEVDSFNHFSLLRSIENLFGLQPLGYTRDSTLPVLNAAIFNAYTAP